jgi:hypothetical protein
LEGLVVCFVAACSGGGRGRAPGTGGGGGTGGSGGGSGGAGAPPSACGSEPFQPPTGGKSFFIAPSGSDSAAGTMAAPFHTMKQAARVAGGGDVVYLRDGVYNQAEDFTPMGDVGNPVVFMAEPGEHPILDGTGLGLGQSDSVLQLYQPQHVVVAGLEIRNSSGRGVQLIDGEDVVIRDCIIHDVQQKALGLNGDSLVAEGNTIYNAVMSNKSSSATGGWASAVTTQTLEDGSASTNVTVQGNLVYDAWGECIDALFVDGMSIIGNEVHDCYSVGIYVDTSRSVRIEGNIIRASDPAYRRSDTGNLIDGILMGAEAYDGVPDFGATDVVIANNLVLGTHNGIGWWNDSDNSNATNTYQRVQIAYNVVWGSAQNAIMFDKVASGRMAPTGAVLTDNILFDGQASASLQIGDTSAWTITANVFPDGKPATASDASNLAGDPQLAAPAVGASADSFRPAATSLCRHAGIPVAAVPLDFACATRGTTDTTVGAFE